MASYHVIGNKKNNREHNADDKTGCGLHEHRNVARSGNPAFINSDKAFRRNGKFIFGVVVITLCSESDSAVFFNNRGYSMGYDCGTVSGRVKEGYYVADFDFLRFKSFVDDKVAAFDLRIHGVGENDKRENSANARDFVRIGKALHDQDKVDYQNRKEDNAHNRSHNGEYVMGKRCLFLCFFFLHSNSSLS